MDPLPPLPPGPRTAAPDGPTNDALAAITAWVEDGLRYVTRHAGDVLALPSPSSPAGALAQLGGTLRWLALASVVATVLLAAAGALLARRAELADVVREIPITMVLLGGWYAAVGAWAEVCRALTSALTPSALLASWHDGIQLDGEIAPFVRVVLSVLMMACLVVLLVEVFVLQHLMTFAVLVGPLAVSLRPWPGLRNVSSRMIRNLATLSLTPALTMAAIGLALGDGAAGHPLSIGEAIAGLAGLTVAAGAPIAVTKLLPLGERAHRTTATRAEAPA